MKNVSFKNQEGFVEYDKDGTETWNKDCVELLATMGRHDAGNGWILGEIYENSYKELKEILKDI